MKKIVFCFFSTLLVLSCSNQPSQQVVSDDTTQARVTEADKQAALEFRRLQKQDAHEAYQAGVRDTLLDFRGKMNAQGGFVWDPVVVEYVRIPSTIENGAFVPSHVAPVIINKGKWVERNGVNIPVVVP